MNGDWFNEGQYWTIHEINPDDPELRKISQRRFAYVFSRLVIGFCISFSVVSLAEPGLFAFEQDYYASQAARDKFGGENAENKTCRAAINSRISTLEANQQQICVTGSSVDQSDRKKRISEIDKKIDELSAKSREYMRYSSDECLGRNFKTEDGRVESTGRVGCKTAADAWKRQAGLIEDQIRPLRAEKAQLQSHIDQGEVASRELAPQRRIQCQGIENELNSARQARATQLASCDARLKTLGGDIESQKGGLMRTIVYHIHMKTDAREEVKKFGGDPDGLGWYLFWLKMFVVFLESALFLSKVLGRVRGYAKSVYRAQAGIAPHGVP